MKLIRNSIFALLLWIGIRMIREALSGKEEQEDLAD